MFYTLIRITTPFAAFVGIIGILGSFMALVPPASAYRTEPSPFAPTQFALFCILFVQSIHIMAQLEREERVDAEARKHQPVIPEPPILTSGSEAYRGPVHSSTSFATALQDFLAWTFSTIYSVIVIILQNLISLAKSDNARIENPRDPNSNKQP